MQISQKQYRIIVLIMTGILLLSMALMGRETARLVLSGSVTTGTGHKPCVVIDSGHGGNDPGKIGADGTLEKDINLSVALLVRDYLEASDIEVIMTRETSDGLYDAGASNKKVQDMKRRVEIIEAAEPDAVVSIHQNSYPEESVSGAQVFYYEGSAAGKLLAQLVQESFLQRLDPGNHRQIKANDSYYLLKKTSRPIVIAECGFLSNSAEAALLSNADYQRRVAWAISIGVLQYLNNAK